MFRVRDFMTKSPITAEPSDKISEVLDLMRLHNIHRVPVVNSSDEIKGLITEGMIAGQGNSATSLSIHELNYLLSKTDVKTVMEKHPITIQEMSLMEEAAQLMINEDIGCLPVVDHANKVVGILTQNDIFKAFLEMLAWNTEGTRIIVGMKDDVGVLAKLSELIASEKVSIRTLSVYSREGDDVRLLVKTDGMAPHSLKDRLASEGYDVLEWENHR